MTLPSFIVLGASRSGTTSIHQYLGQHPQIFMCRRKSPNYFVAGDPIPSREKRVLRQMADQWISDLGAYQALFSEARDELAIGEVSPVYLQSRAAAGRIRKLCPEAKLVAILRDPAERAWAHFLGRRRDGLETREDFQGVVESELKEGLPDDVAFGSYLGCSRYGRFLSLFFDLFPAEQIKIFLFDELLESPRAVLRDIFEFLEVDPSASQLVDLARHNRSGLIDGALRRLLWTRSVALRTAVRPYLPERVRRLAAPIFLSELKRPQLDPQIRKQICRALASDIELCQRLLERDLSRWCQA